MKLHIGWTAARGWCTAPWSPQPTCTTSTRCPICCIGAERRVMATAPTPARSRLSSPRRHRPLTSPTSAHAGAATSTRPCGAKNRTQVPGARPRRARVRRGQAAVGVPQGFTAAWPRTPRARLWRWLWPTSSPREEHYMDRCVHSARQAGQCLAARPKRPGKWRNARQNRTAAPEIPPSRRQGTRRERSAIGWRLAATCSALPVHCRAPERAGGC